MDSYDLELYHHGVLGMRWGVRNFQNYDGSLKAVGQIHRHASSSIKSGISFVKTNASAKYVDTMDVLNRKGVLDFLDSKAESPFRAIATAAPRYHSKSYDDFDLAAQRIKRYSSMIADGRQELPLNKITDTGKSWMESFKDSNGNRFMMGWNHLDIVEKRAMTRGMNKLAEYTERAEYTGHKLSDMMRDNKAHLTSTIPGDELVTRNRYGEKLASSRTMTEVEHDTLKREAAKEFIRQSGEIHGWGQIGWDRNTSYRTGDLGKINDVIYARGGGVQGVSSAVRRNSVDTPFDENGRLWSREVFAPHSRGNGQLANWDNIYNKKVNDWVKEHSNDVRHDSLELSDFIAHHGTKGMHWGVRNYQNTDGSLTPMGRVRYGVGAARKAAQKSAAAAANAIRRKIKPTDEEKMAYVQKKQAKADLNAQYRMAKGKDIKDPSKLSDQELARQLQRKRAEEEYKRLSGKGDDSLLKMAAKSVKENAARAVGDLAKDAITKRGQDLLKSKEEREYEDAKREADTISNRLKATKDASELLYRNSEQGRAALELDRMHDSSKKWKEIAEYERDRAKTSAGKSSYDRAKENAEIAKYRRQAVEEMNLATAYGTGAPAKDARKTIEQLATIKKGKQNNNGNSKKKGKKYAGKHFAK